MHHVAVSTSTNVRDNLIKLPNFLIVGASRSGTTSLYHYLKQHPEVYMSPVKEPRFMTAQFAKFSLKGIGDEESERGIIKTLDEYKRLFENVRNEKAVGEASVVNLYLYEGAVKQIKKYLGEEVKIIIILRNPVERAFSHYLRLIRNSKEFLSFEDGLKMEKKRIEDGWLPNWHYTCRGFYYNQVKAYMENFSQFRVYLHDDLQKDTLALMKDIYEFLEVDSSFIPDIKIKHNVSGIPKNKFIHNLTKPTLLKTYIKPIIKPFLPKEKRRKLTENLNKLIESLKIKNLEKPQMKPETREYLKNLYREDVLKLQVLINRDLSHWLR